MRTRSIRTTLALSIVSLALAASTFAQTTLNFPRLTGSTGTITGVAIGNPDPTNTADVTITAYGTTGNVLAGAGITNPVQVSIPAGQQFSRVTSEIFGEGLAEDLVGWFQATSTASNLSGFFLFLDTDMTVFDGADLPPLEHKLVFNRVRIGNGHSTELNLFNPNQVDSGIDLLLLDGEDIIQTDPDNIDFTLSAHGVRRLDVADYFGVNTVTDGATVLVISDTQIGGFQFVRRAGADLVGLNARPAGEFLNTLTFPQLAVLGPWVMQIGVSNYSNQNVSMVITAYQPDGSRYDAADLAQNPVTRMLGPGLSLLEDVETMFGFTGDEALEGWVQVTADSSSVNGYVTYGIPANGSEAAVATVAGATQRALFSHIATTLGFFTGIAALNAGASFADLEIIASQQDGTVLGSFTTVLGPGERLSSLLSALIPAAAGQAGGLVLARSNRPLHFTSLFGTESGTVLANIPPQDVPATYRPATGLPEIQLTPDQVVLGPGQAQQFAAEGATDAVTWAVRGQSGGPEDNGMVDETGNYQAPADPDGSVLAGVTATQGARVGSATIDVLEQGNAITPGIVTATAYHPTLDQVFLAGQPSGVGSAGGSSQIVRVNGSALENVASIVDQIGALVPVDLRVRQGELDYTLQPFLLALGTVLNRVYRVDPATGDVVEILSSTSELTDLASDPVTGALLLSNVTGIETISMINAEVDLLQLPDEAVLPPIFALDSPGQVTSLAVDGCTGSIFFSQATGGVFRLNGSVEEVVSGVSVERLRAVYRRDFGCPDGPRLLSADPAGRVIMVRPSSGDFIDWQPGFSAADFTWIPGSASGSGEDAVVLAGTATGAQGVSSQVIPVEVAGLFQPQAINPVDAVPTGTITDPTGDVFGDAGVLQQEALEMTALMAPGGQELVIDVYFGETISPCLEPCPSEETPIDAVVGFIDLDVSRDTGLISTIDINSPFASGLKTNFCLDFNVYDPSLGGVAMFRTLEDAGDRFEFVGRVPVEFSPLSFRVRVPQSLIGNPAPEDIRLAAVMGSPEQPTDTVPNGGFLQVQVTGTAGVADSPAVTARTGQSERVVYRRVRDAKGKWTRLVPE